jgi:hypothetical protein
VATTSESRNRRPALRCLPWARSGRGEAGRVVAHGRAEPEKRLESGESTTATNAMAKAQATAESPADTMRFHPPATRMSWLSVARPSSPVDPRGECRRAGATIDKPAGCGRRVWRRRCATRRARPGGRAGSRRSRSPIGRRTGRRRTRRNAPARGGGETTGAATEDRDHEPVQEKDEEDGDPAEPVQLGQAIAPAEGRNRGQGHRATVEAAFGPPPDSYG